MEFLNPWMLLGLLLVPVAILLHVFRAPGRRHEVSSLALWRDVLRRAGPEATEKLKRFDWLLLLEILVIVLLVLGLASPVVWTVRPRRNVGIILDDSASMGTVERGGKARRDEAAGVIRRIEAQLSANDVVSRYMGPAGSGDVAIDPEKLLADGLAAFGMGPQVIFLVTDKPPAEVDDPRVRVVALGGPSRNVGIVAFSGEPAADGTLDLFVRVVNYSGAEAPRQLTVWNASKKLASEDLRLPVFGGVAEKVFRVRVSGDDPASPTGYAGASPVVRVKIEGVDDGFPADDEVAGVLRTLTVVAIGKEISPAYARLFGGPVFEGTIYVEAPEGAGVPPDSLVIAEGVVPASRGVVTALVNPPAGEVAGITVGNPALLAQPASPVAVGTDSLVAGVNLSEMRLADFRPLTLGENAHPLMRVAGQVAAAVADEAGSKVIVLGFDPARAGWTLKPSFVVFWANVLAEARNSAGLARRSLGEGGGLVAYRPGDAVRLPLGAEKGSVNGAEVLPGKDGWGAFVPTRVGVYEWTAGSRRGFFAANLLSEIESDNRPPSPRLRRTSPSPLVGKPPSFDLPAPLAGASIPLGPWLCLAAGILAALWWHLRR